MLDLVEYSDATHVVLFTKNGYFVFKCRFLNNSCSKLLAGSYWSTSVFH